jgi:hypothetical protein
MDSATRKRLYNLCDPENPLAPEDPLRVDPDTLNGRSSGMASLARELKSIRPQTRLLATLEGIGVTTELRRLAERLGPSGVGFHIVSLDASTLFDLRESVSATALLLALLEAVDDTVGSRFGEDPGSVSRRRLLATGLPPAEDFDAFASEVREELVLLREFVRARGARGIVVLVDSLERLHGLAVNEGATEKTDEVRRLFHEDLPRIRLPVHAVYAAPLAWALGAPWAQTWPLAALTGRQGSATMREILHRRIPEIILREMLGDQSYATGVDEMLRIVAGSPRRLVFLLRELVVASDSLPIDPHRLRRILDASGVRLRRFLKPRHAAQLLREGEAVRREDLRDADQARKVARLLNLGALVPAFDGEWHFHFHPHVYSISAPTEVAAVA